MILKYHFKIWNETENTLLFILVEWVLIFHSRPENLKKSRSKNGQKSIFELGKSLKLSQMQFHEKKFFWPNSIFCSFKNGQKSIFELGKSLKLPKMQFHEKICLIYLISRVDDGAELNIVWWKHFLIWDRRT